MFASMNILIAYILSVNGTMAIKGSRPRIAVFIFLKCPFQTQCKSQVVKVKKTQVSKTLDLGLKVIEIQLSLLKKFILLF